MSIKKAVKKKLNSGKLIDADALYESIRDYDYISFDIFDTLVKRNVEEPTDIFSIIEKAVDPGFSEKRIEAENRARVEFEKKEITIEDIYDYFPDADRQKLIDLEIDTEFKAIVPNQFVAAVYHRCLDAGKTIFIISDIYWSEEAVKVLLEKNGFSGYKKIYLSSVEQKVKSDGTLFKKLLEQEQINPTQLIHIGDSQKSDYEEPKKLGIKAIKIPRYLKNVEFRGDNQNDKIEVNYLNHFINNTVPYSKDPYYLFGYSQFGKLLFGYVRWIHDKAVKRGIEKIFFFARDGYIMKQAYEACIDDPNIEIRYLEVSRRSLRGPVLWMDCSYETILKMVVNAKLVSLMSVFDGLGLEIYNYVNQIKSCGLEPDVVFDRSTIESDDRLRKLIEDIKPDIIDNSKEEYELLKRYLAENDVVGKFAVVDIGYAGSMQRYLQQVLRQIGIEHEITGYYLCIADYYKKNMLPGVKMDMNGYLFDFSKSENSVDTRRSFVGLFESLFLEGGGTVRRYLSTESHVKAERYPYEYLRDGKLTEDCEKVKKIQKGALDFVANASMDSFLNSSDLQSSNLFFGLYKVGTSPTNGDIRMFADMEFFDEGIQERLAKPKRCTHYILHPRELKIDFLRCRWKIGFMKRLLKLPLPYLRMYELLQALS